MIITKQKLSKLSALELISNMKNISLTEKIKITGFGIFRLVKTAPKKVYNFHTKETMTAPAGIKIKFRSAKAFQRTFNETGDK